MDSTTSPKVKTIEGEGVRACFVACSISRVEGSAELPGWGLGRLTNNSIIYTDLYKSNHKLVSA